jgi:orotate phosphoribosyltransferase
VQKIKEENLSFDVIAGIETAGIPHSSALAYVLKKPSVFVRKKPKEHGTKSKIEGGDVKGKKVLLVEDLVTTGGSSLAGMQALRQEQARVTDCLVIVTYGFPESQKAFEEAQVNVHALTSFEDILQEAERLAKITPKERETIQTWLQNPHEWRN